MQKQGFKNIAKRGGKKYFRKRQNSIGVSEYWNGGKPVYQLCYLQWFGSSQYLLCFHFQSLSKLHLCFTSALIPLPVNASSLQWAANLNQKRNKVYRSTFFGPRRFFKLKNSLQWDFKKSYVMLCLFKHFSFILSWKRK